MGWNDGLDALVQETITLAEKASESSSTPPPSVPLNLIEAAFKETAPPPPSQALNWADAEREQIRKRVANFRQHQERLRREREDYYERTMWRARRLADGVMDAAELLEPMAGQPSR